MIKSLYIHIPFCDNICSYCDFVKVYSKYFSHQKYLESLIYELKSLNIKNKMDTIYIGGGTPSCLTCEEISFLFSNISYLIDETSEVTFEANPESLTLDKILILKKNKVNRVSLGVESSNSKINKILNRKHTNKQVIEVIKNLKSNNINNINLDFIYGLEQTSCSNVKEDLDFALGLDVTHLSFYSLMIEDNTIFKIKNIHALDDDNLREEYDYINQYLKKNNFIHYEVSNYAKDGYFSRHNLTYWKDNKYYAIGLGASSYINNVRYTCTKSITKYLKNEFNYSKEYIDKKDEEFEFIMLNLRLLDGFSLQEYKKRFKKDFLDVYKKQIEKVKDYLIINDKVKIKENYIYTMNDIVITLLDF